MPLAPHASPKYQKVQKQRSVITLTLKCLLHLILKWPQDLTVGSHKQNKTYLFYRQDVVSLMCEKRPEQVIRAMVSYSFFPLRGDSSLYAGKQCWECGDDQIIVVPAFPFFP